jgi:GNAT superfamily N-acetyltransferase
VGFEELKIREAALNDARSIGKVLVSSWQTANRGIVPDDILDAMSVDQQEIRYRQALSEEKNEGRILIAEDHRGEVVGFCFGGDLRKTMSLNVDLADIQIDSELYAIYLLAEYRRNGLGLLLFGPLRRKLIETGKKKMIAWAFENSPFGSFYQKLGAKPEHSNTMELSGRNFSMTGWSLDLSL